MILGICGAGGLGREVLQLAKEINAYKPCFDGFVFVDDYIDKKSVSNVDIVRFDDIVSLYNNEQLKFVIALGEPQKRVNEYNRIISKGYGLYTLKHPSVTILEDTIIGNGVIINKNCIISCGVNLMDNVLIQPMASVGHDSSIGMHTVISSFASLGGGVSIGDGSYIAMSVPIKQCVSIGANVIVGLGSIIRNDIEDNVITFGSPLKIINNDGRWKVFS